MANIQDSEERKTLQKELESKRNELTIYTKELKSDGETVNTLQQKISEKETEIEDLSWYQRMAFYIFFGKYRTPVRFVINITCLLQLMLFCL